MRKQNGITMLTLIISIIVMTILAGVVITMVVGDSSVITESRQATADTESSAIVEEVRAAWGTLEVDYWIASEDERTNYFTKENLNKYLSNEGKVTDFDYEAGGISKGIYTKNDGTTYSFEINTEGYAGLANSGESTATETTYLVMFYNEDGTVLLGTDEVATGVTAECPAGIPEKEGYEFSYWALDTQGGTQADLSNVTADIKVYSYFTLICFAPGTEVLTENGLMAIENIDVGMKVYSKNEETGAVELKTVLDTMINEVDLDMARVTVNGEVITSTAGHDYYTVNKGWIDARNLEIGDVLLNSNDEEVLVENVEVIEFNGEFNTVYNFTVEDNHNYYVGEEMVLVHNAPSPTGHSGGTAC